MNFVTVLFTSISSDSFISKQVVPSDGVAVGPLKCTVNPTLDTDGTPLRDRQAVVLSTDALYNDLAFDNGYEELNFFLDLKAKYKSPNRHMPELKEKLDVYIGVTSEKLNENEKLKHRAVKCEFIRLEVSQAFDRKALNLPFMNFICFQLAGLLSDFSLVKKDKRFNELEYDGEFVSLHPFF